MAAEVVGVKAATVLELNPAAIKLQVCFLSGKINLNEKSSTVTFQDKWPWSIVHSYREVWCVVS